MFFVPESSTVNGILLDRDAPVKLRATLGFSEKASLQRMDRNKGILNMITFKSNSIGIFGGSRLLGPHESTFTYSTAKSDACGRYLP